MQTVKTNEAASRLLDLAASSSHHSAFWTPPTRFLVLPSQLLSFRFTALSSNTLFSLSFSQVSQISDHQCSQVPFVVFHPPPFFLAMLT